MGQQWELLLSKVWKPSVLGKWIYPTSRPRNHHITLLYDDTIHHQINLHKTVEEVDHLQLLTGNSLSFGRGRKINDCMTLHRQPTA